MSYIKIVFVGDSSVGKTSVIRRYDMNLFDQTYCPTVYDRYQKFHRFENEVYHLTIEDTSGQPDYARLRPLQYKDADVFVICFAIADDPHQVIPKHSTNLGATELRKKVPAIAENSFLNVSSYWCPEVCHYRTARAKMVLLGTKSDLREVSDPVPDFIVTSQKGAKLAKDLKLDAYLECSSKSDRNFGVLFDKLLETHFQKDTLGKARRKPWKCQIL